MYSRYFYSYSCIWKMKSNGSDLGIPKNDGYMAGS